MTKHSKYYGKTSTSLGVGREQAEGGGNVRAGGVLRINKDALCKGSDTKS